MSVMRKTVLLFVTAAMVVGLANTAAARTTAKPQLKWVRCWPVADCQARDQVVEGATLRIAGKRLRSGMTVVFRGPGPRKKRRSAVAVLKAPGRLEVKVPKGAKSGRIEIRIRKLRSNRVGPITIERQPKERTQPTSPTTDTQTSTVFDGDGMWIWYIKKSSGGDPADIIAQARAGGIETVFIKSGDGDNYWEQFSPELIGGLKAGGLKVCAWQYVYGSKPSSEAEVSRQAVAAGADCFVIDAEAEYEGRYAAASKYIQQLRGAVGDSYPIGLAAFPYVDYHPSFPYSVFLAPGGAQFNLPQMYWRAIGTTVDRAYAHTYVHNRPYKRPIMPLGQTYQSPGSDEITRFRQLATAYGASGISWWDWQETPSRIWTALGQSITPLAIGPDLSYPELKKSHKGDLVIWAQEHLQAAGQNISVDGAFGSGTQQAVIAFQAAQGLEQSGRIDDATWQALLRLEPVVKNWAVAASASSTRDHYVRGGPVSAQLRSRRNELGRPKR